MRPFSVTPASAIPVLLGLALLAASTLNVAAAQPPSSGQRIDSADSVTADLTFAQPCRHGFGSHFASFGSFLKFELVMKLPIRYVGSSTIVVTMSHWSPFGNALGAVKYSVTTALSP